MWAVRKGGYESKNKFEALREEGDEEEEGAKEEEECKPKDEWMNKGNAIGEAARKTNS